MWDWSRPLWLRNAGYRHSSQETPNSMLDMQPFNAVVAFPHSSRTEILVTCQEETATSELAFP